MSSQPPFEPLLDVDAALQRLHSSGFIVASGKFTLKKLPKAVEAADPIVNLPTAQAAPAPRVRRGIANAKMPIPDAKPTSDVLACPEPPREQDPHRTLF